MVRESVRSLQREGREFVLHYTFTTEETEEGQRCRIQASLSEKVTGGAPRSNCSVELPYLDLDAGRKLFEMIAGAEDPVFPVHVADIVRDHLLEVFTSTGTGFWRSEGAVRIAP